MVKSLVLRTTRQGDSIVVHLMPEATFGHSASERVQSDLTELYVCERPQQVLVDFSNIEAVSSSVIAVLLSFRQRLEADGVRLALCGMSEHLRKKLRVLHLEGTVFQVYDTHEDAVISTAQ